MHISEATLVDAVLKLCEMWSVRVTRDYDEYRTHYESDHFSFTSPICVGRHRPGTTDGPARGYPRINVEEGMIYWPRDARVRWRVWVLVHELAHLVSVDSCPSSTDEEDSRMAAFECVIAHYLEQLFKTPANQLADQWMAWRQDTGSASSALGKVVDQHFEKVKDEFFHVDTFQPTIRAWMPGESLALILDDIAAWRRGEL